MMGSLGATVHVGATGNLGELNVNDTLNLTKETPWADESMAFCESFPTSIECIGH